MYDWTNEQIKTRCNLYLTLFLVISFGSISGGFSFLSDFLKEDFVTFYSESHFEKESARHILSF
jgi:hypothetical protein